MFEQINLDLENLTDSAWLNGGRVADNNQEVEKANNKIDYEWHSYPEEKPLDKAPCIVACDFLNNYYYSLAYYSADLKRDLKDNYTEWHKKEFGTEGFIEEKVTEYFCCCAYVSGWKYIEEFNLHPPKSKKC